jgi:hypothetical protein
VLCFGFGNNYCTADVEALLLCFLKNILDERGVGSFGSFFETILQIGISLVLCFSKYLLQGMCNWNRVMMALFFLNESLFHLWMWWGMKRFLFLSDKTLF